MDMKMKRLLTAALTAREEKKKRRAERSARLLVLANNKRNKERAVARAAEFVREYNRPQTRLMGSRPQKKTVKKTEKKQASLDSALNRLRAKIDTEEQLLKALSDTEQQQRKKLCSVYNDIVYRLARIRNRLLKVISNDFSKATTDRQKQLNKMKRLQAQVTARPNASAKFADKLQELVHSWSVQNNKAIFSFSHFEADFFLKTLAAKYGKTTEITELLDTEPDTLELDVTADSSDRCASPVVTNERHPTEPLDDLAEVSRPRKECSSDRRYSKHKRVLTGPTGSNKRLNGSHETSRPTFSDSNEKLSEPCPGVTELSDCFGEFTESNQRLTGSNSGGTSPVRNFSAANGVSAESLGTESSSMTVDAYTGPTEWTSGPPLCGPSSSRTSSGTDGDTEAVTQMDVFETSAHRFGPSAEAPPSSNGTSSVGPSSSSTSSGDRDAEKEWLEAIVGTAFDHQSQSCDRPMEAQNADTERLNTERESSDSTANLLRSGASPFVKTDLDSSMTAVMVPVSSEVQSADYPMNATIIGDEMGGTFCEPEEAFFEVKEELSTEEDEGLVIEEGNWACSSSRVLPVELKLPADAVRFGSFQVSAKKAMSMSHSKLQLCVSVSRSPTDVNSLPLSPSKKKKKRRVSFAISMSHIIGVQYCMQSHMSALFFTVTAACAKNICQCLSDLPSLSDRFNPLGGESKRYITILLGYCDADKRKEFKQFFRRISSFRRKSLIEEISAERAKQILGQTSLLSPKKEGQDPEVLILSD